VAEEGVADAAPAVGGGADSFIAGVKEFGTEEATEGEIIATMAGENFFAFLKKAFSSERVNQPSPSQAPHHVHMKTRRTCRLCPARLPLVALICFFFVSCYFVFILY
jgi:hypothetical protein